MQIVQRKCLSWTLDVFADVYVDVRAESQHMHMHAGIYILSVYACTYAHVAVCVCCFFIRFFTCVSFCKHLAKQCCFERCQATNIPKRETTTTTKNKEVRMQRSHTRRYLLTHTHTREHQHTHLSIVSCSCRLSSGFIALPSIPRWR